MNEPTLRRFLRAAFAGAVLFGADSSLADTQVVDGIEWTYTLTEGEATVGGGDWESPAIPVSTSGAISIPRELGGCPVTTIGDGAFCDCSNVTSVTIRAGVTSIGANAFWRCSGLKTVAIPDGVTNIGYRAFARCTGLTSIAIPAGVTSVETFAFAGCSGLTSISIPGSLTSIGYDVFPECSGLTAFAVDSANPAYSSSDGLLLSKDGKTLICGINGDVTIPGGVMHIEDFAFYGYLGLTSVAIPDSVTSIGNYAFDGCSGLTSISCGKGLESVDWERVFYGCSALASITVDTANPVFDSRNGCNAVILTADNELVFGCRATIVPDTVTGIGYNAFANCSGLVSIEIPDSVTSIGWGAFENCSNLESITVPYAFKDVLSASGISENCRVETRAPLQLAFRTPPAWPDAVTEAQYSQSLDVIGGLRPYRFEIVDDGSWPYWLSSIEDWSDDGDRPWLWGVPGSDDAGASTFVIRVTDANGTSVTNTFTLVVEKNEAPVIKSWTPEASRFRLDPGAMTNFTVTATDPDGDELSYRWEIAVWGGDDWWWKLGDQQGNAFVFDSSTYGGGYYRIEAYASDGEYSVCRSWTVFVWEEAWTMYTPVPVPYSWLERYYVDLGPWGDYYDYEYRAFDDAANGENAVWECYVAGLCPTNAADRFLATIGFDENGEPDVKWMPDLGGARDYVVLGKANLVDESWGPTNESTRFFRVKVSMP